jgi:RNA-directed DNA polymerase
MKIEFFPQDIEVIKLRFGSMKDIEDLVNLLNSFPFNPEIYSYIIAENNFDNNTPKDSQLNFVVQGSNTKQIKISAKQLNFYSSSFNDPLKRRFRYRKFNIPKKNGSNRTIEAPVKQLKLIQKGLLSILQVLFSPPLEVMGFVPGRGIKSNAAAHVGSNFILNVDIQNFFPSISFRRIKAVLELPPFLLTGEREKLAYIIANLVTENGTLPQGAPTSPFFTNVVCQNLDRRLASLAKHFNAIYTRYADDITFSCNEYIFTKRFLEKLRKILSDERFQINHKKTRIQGKAYRQVVTGLTVNENVNVPKHIKRKIRTLFHIYKTKGAESALDYYQKTSFKKNHYNLGVLTIKQKENQIKKIIQGKHSYLRLINPNNCIPLPYETKRIKGLNTRNANSLIVLSNTQDSNFDGKKILIANEPDLFFIRKYYNIDSALIKETLDLWESVGFEVAMSAFNNAYNEKRS